MHLKRPVDYFYGVPHSEPLSLPQMYFLIETSWTCYILTPSDVGTLSDLDVQVMLREMPSIAIHDFRHSDEGERETQRKARAELLSKDMAQPFDLSKSVLDRQISTDTVDG